jgi:hypothetical protein
MFKATCDPNFFGFNSLKHLYRYENDKNRYLTILRQ